MSQPPPTSDDSPAEFPKSPAGRGRRLLPSSSSLIKVFKYGYSLGLALMLTQFFYSQLTASPGTGVLDFTEPALAAALGGACGYGCFLFLSALFNSDKESAKELSDLSKEADSELGTIEEAGDILALLRYNRSQMMEYDKAAKLQEKRANRSAQMATWVGFFIISAGALVVLIRPLNTSQTIATTTLLACGATLSGYCARTFFQAAKAATQNAAYYFQNPLAVSYLLQAERLAETLPEDERTARKEEVIRAFIQQADYASRAAVPRIEGGDEDV